MAYSPQTWADGSGGGTPLTAARLNHMETGIEDADTRITTLEGGSTTTDTALRNTYGYPLSSFSGVSNDDKLTTALTASAAETYPFAVLIDNDQQWTFTTSNRVAFDGMRIVGPPGYSNPERLSSTKMASRVHLNFSGSWFRNPVGADVFSVAFHNLSFTGGGGASGPNVIGQNGSGTWYCLEMRNIYSSSLRTVVGTQATAVLLTAAQFDGSWEINNCYNGAFHMGGSDNTFWPQGMLLDSGTGFATAGSANGQYHLWFDFMEKSHIGPLYITCEGAWNGVRVQGSLTPHTFTSTSANLGGPLTFYGTRIEGRNQANPCNGSVFRQEGGIVRLRDCWLAYGMASPSTPGHSPQDAGMYHMTGGVLLADGTTYDKTTSVALSVPLFYVAAGEARIFNVARGARGGSWSTTRPTVDEVTASTVTGDTTITVV
jgi:hypothetical protein